MPLIDIQAQLSPFNDWPEVPEGQRPKRLPHNGGIDQTSIQILQAKGWTPTDVRLMPNGSDAERGECLKAWLEGIRLGTIPSSKEDKFFLELEAKALGLTSNRNQNDIHKRSDINATSLSSILDFAMGGKDEDKQVLQATKKAKGRPKGSKNKKKEDNNVEGSID